ETDGGRGAQIGGPFVRPPDATTGGAAAPNPLSPTGRECDGEHCGNGTRPICSHSPRAGSGGPRSGAVGESLLPFNTAEIPVDSSKLAGNSADKCKGAEPAVSEVAVERGRH